MLGPEFEFCCVWVIRRGQKGSGRFLLVCITFWLVAIFTHCSRSPESQLSSRPLDQRWDLDRKSIRTLRTLPRTPPFLADQLNQKPIKHGQTPLARPAWVSYLCFNPRPARESGATDQQLVRRVHARVSIRAPLVRVPARVRRGRGQADRYGATRLQRAMSPPGVRREAGEDAGKRGGEAAVMPLRKTS